MTRFLVDGPSAAGISRETLIEAVRALLRERDYLRRARDIQLADSQQEASALRAHAEELEERLQLETHAARGQAQELERELEALREERETLLRQRDEVLADRDAVVSDRDMWRARAKGRTGGVRQVLRALAGRWLRPEQGTGRGAEPSPGDDRTRT